MADPRHLVFVGLMGSGKTTVGRAVAERLGLPFADNDTALAGLTQRTAAEVQARDGVAVLHELEATILRQQLGAPGPTVVAAAASTIEDAATRQLLDERAIVIWLRADVETLAERVRGASFRPLEDNPRDALRDQSARRAAAFESVADVIVDTADRPVDDLADHVAAALTTAMGGQNAANHGHR